MKVCLARGRFYSMSGNYKVEVIVAMVCITVLEVVALLKGIDGSLLSMVVAVLAGLAGYKYREAKENYARKR